MDDNNDQDEVNIPDPEDALPLCACGHVMHRHEGGRNACTKCPCAVFEWDGVTFSHQPVVCG